MKKALSIFIVMIMVITTVALVNLVAAQSLVRNPKRCFQQLKLSKSLNQLSSLNQSFKMSQLSTEIQSREVVEQISKDPEIEAPLTNKSVVRTKIF
ncbi:hypothetical protein MGH68_14285 [Erysipelothrix sp. D19-032]